MQMRLPGLKDLSRFATDFLLELELPGVVGLRGPLGAGKTTFVREVISQIARNSGKAPPRVASPSFVLHIEYADLTPPVQHFDLYRLAEADDKALTEIGYFDALEKTVSQKGVLFVEWPEHCKSLKLLELSVLFYFGLDETGVHFVQKEAL